MTQESKKSAWIGKIVGGAYEVVEKLTETGHSEIFWGRNVLDGPDAAIKVSVEIDDDPFLSDRLNREGTVLATLKGQPAVPRLFDRRFTQDGHLVLVLELLDGMSLQSMLARGDRRLDIDEIITLFGPVIETLSALHQRGIIHRNIHLGKLFRSWDPPGLKLLGYGDTSSVRAASRGNAERYFGDPKYVAPEVWQGSAELDERADIYSLAVVLFRCLAGRCPYEIESAVELVKVPSRTLPSLASLTSGLPEALDDWAAIALATEPNGRFDNIRAMWTAFIRASQSAPQQSENGASETSTTAETASTATETASIAADDQLRTA